MRMLTVSGLMQGQLVHGVKGSSAKARVQPMLLVSSSLVVGQGLAGFKPRLTKAAGEHPGLEVYQSEMKIKKLRKK